MTEVIHKGRSQVGRGSDFFSEVYCTRGKWVKYGYNLSNVLMDGPYVCVLSFLPSCTLYIRNIQNVNKTSVNDLEGL